MAIKLKYASEVYSNVETVVNSLSAKEIRTEYSRLRSIARKRLERFAGSKYAKVSKTYKKNKNRFPAVPDIKTKRTMARKLAEVKKFLSLKTSSLSGYKQVRAERIAALQKADYTWINEDNFDMFDDFMEHNRAIKDGGQYDSERVLDLVREASRTGLDSKTVKKDFDYWMTNLKGLEKAPAVPSEWTGTKKASEELRKFLDAWNSQLKK